MATNAGGTTRSPCRPYERSGKCAGFTTRDYIVRLRCESTKAEKDENDENKCTLQHDVQTNGKLGMDTLCS